MVGIALSGRSSSTAVLACRLCERTCALPLELVIETMRPLPIEEVSGMPRSVLGVAVVRGAPVPVVDPRRLFGTPNSVALRWVTVRTGARTVALAVDHVIGVRTIESSRLTELPPLLADAAEGAIEAIASSDADLLLVLDATRLAPEELFAGTP